MQVNAYCNKKDNIKWFVHENVKIELKARTDLWKKYEKKGNMKEEKKTQNAITDQAGKNVTKKNKNLEKTKKREQRKQG